ncbi:FecR family protein [Wenyingzhuangia sp. chi5]|uniref:FecR family protein n=1 Tax=Wenyingzhuangia gilva TaxID=3057677 RepID=A0ABT8VPZ8_9FLAO|nr:FecR family protein [Wenyingzhuangia sp. chi5]MDO3694022.1 FecR family protein [Wenyingzhuangia sp. chi5]
MKDNDKIDDTFLARWLNNELTEKELSDFKNSEDYVAYKKIAQKSTLFRVPAFDETRTFEAIQHKIYHQNKKVKKLVPNWVYVMAAAAVLVFGFFLFKEDQTTITCGVGEQLAYVLPDGSQVELNGNSSIIYVEKKWKEGKRELDITGEGYFKVKKGSTFSVTTKEGKISVLGTQFNIQSIDEFLAVECYEGKVKVENKVEKTILTPGKGVKINQAVKQNYIVTDSVPNWKVNKYNYNAIPLKVVFKDLQNVYQLKFINNGVDLSKLYTGKLLKNDINKALQIICKPMNITFEVKEKTVIISQ